MPFFGGSLERVVRKIQKYQNDRIGNINKKFQYFNDLTHIRHRIYEKHVFWAKYAQLWPIFAPEDTFRVKFTKIVFIVYRTIHRIFLHFFWYILICTHMAQSFKDMRTFLAFVPYGCKTDNAKMCGKNLRIDWHLWNFKIFEIWALHYDKTSKSA